MTAWPFWTLALTKNFRQNQSHSLPAFLFFCKFFRNFAARSQNIRGLLKSEGVINWPNECQLEFEDLQAELKKHPLLGHPDFTENSQPFIVTVDTSSLGTGSILSQIQKVENPESKKFEAKEVIISYDNKALSWLLRTTNRCLPFCSAGNKFSRNIFLMLSLFSVLPYVYLSL